MGAQCAPLARCGLDLCFDFLKKGDEADHGSSTDALKPCTMPNGNIEAGRSCGHCGKWCEEFAPGPRGEQLCRACLRLQDEKLLQPISMEEQKGLDLVSSILEGVSWKYWKPGEQPAQLLDWLYLGDLQEAMDFELLARRGITAVLNLINWWELTARLPDVADFASLYASHNMLFLETDSEDRLFFDLIANSWPCAEAYLQRCRDEKRKVLVNCKAGHNRSACVCICWLMMHENLSLIDAVELVQQRRGMILSNHGFRLQLVRLALQWQQFGDCESVAPCTLAAQGPENGAKRANSIPLGSIITKKRLSTDYDKSSRDFTSHAASEFGFGNSAPNMASVISRAVTDQLSQRKLKMELLACLYHRQKKFSTEYEFTTDPPTVVGSGFSGEVTLCKSRVRTAVGENDETSIRCVKRFRLQQMGPDRIDKLKNEAVIYLQLEHPHIARLFDVYEDHDEVSLVMQYCSGGTLEDALRIKGAFGEEEFQDVAVQMLSAVNYIHRIGIVHRDIKPRNFVYEADGATIKLIDFGFSVKGYLSGDSSGLQGCMGTLGYLAPEVAHAGRSLDAPYTEKCDMWSLGAVFYELLAGQPAFHRENGQCDGYTQDVVLREIEDVSVEGVETLLKDIPKNAVSFIRRLLTKEISLRPSAAEALDDPYLASARTRLSRPNGLPMSVVLERVRAHGLASKTTRAWLLAVARSPTYLPWKEFCTLRNTFKWFDAHSLNGTVSLESFRSVLGTFCDNDNGNGLEEIARIWHAVCGEQDSLSYCEFLATILPPVEDVFEDVSTVAGFPRQTSPSPECGTPILFSYPSNQWCCEWDPSQPISCYIPLLNGRKGPIIVASFHETVRVQDVVNSMSNTHSRWVIVEFDNGQREFFDYMDLNHHLVTNSGSAKPANSNLQRPASEIMARVSEMPVGLLANRAQTSAFVPVDVSTPLREVLGLISKQNETHTVTPVRRVAIVNDSGVVLHVFSCLDFLKLALRFAGPTAILKSRAARTFDRRTTIMNTSVMHNASVISAMQTMDKEHETICPATSRELSGDLGGVVAINVVSVSDLKWVISLGQFDVLHSTVEDFIAWRASVATAKVENVLRFQRLQRFNVISVDAGDSLYSLAKVLVASKLHRILLSSDEIARIVGIVSCHDILMEVMDQLI